MNGSSSFESYANKYENIDLKRNDGVLEVFFGSKTVLTWDRHLSDSLIELFGHIRDDPSNVIVILNGRDEFWLSKEEGQPIKQSKMDAMTPLEVFLEIKVPVISVIPGNLGWFSEIPLMGDIVLASERSTFSEFSLLREEPSINSIVRKTVLRYLLGPRERSFCYAVKPITASEAKNIGLVSELHDQSDLLNRAKELSFKFLRRDRKLLEMIKADSLVSLKQQIKRVRNKFAEDYDNDIDSALGKSQLSSGGGSNDTDAKVSMKSPSIEAPSFQSSGEPVHSIPLKRDLLKNDGFSLHGEEISEIIEDNLVEETGIQQVSPSLIEKKESSVDQVIFSLSNEGNESEVKLNLAKAYIELGHYQSAELILDELSIDFGDELKAEILKLQAQISN